MDRFVIKDGKQLRLGYTTGTCAAAAAKAAAITLLTGEAVNSVGIQTPSGVSLVLEIVDMGRGPDSVYCAVIKDAGDDPDATDGIKIFAQVSLCGNGVTIDGGFGVGRVTSAGLPVEVGKAAINPVPYKMIENELSALIREYGCQGLKAVISVPRGEEIAKRTFNPRLGILGGISILGTTGIVEPMSEKALVETIKLDIKMRHAAESRELVITPGNYGMDFIGRHYDYQLEKAVKCSNFIGEALDYAAYLKFGTITLIGHAGKILKLGAGIMNTHSRTADGRMEILAAHAAIAGATGDKSKALMECITTEAAISLLDQWGLTDDVMESLGEKIKFHLSNRVGEGSHTRFIMFLGNRVLAKSF